MRALPVCNPFRIPSCLRCAGLLAVLLLSGCGSPGLIKHDSRLTELRNEEPKAAWLDDGLLIVRYKADKDDSYAGARWLAGELPRLTYTHTYSRLEFLGEELPQELADTTGLSRVSVQTSNTWLALLRRLVDDLVPAEPGIGVALHIRNDEQVIYRDEAGNLARSRFGEQPDSVTISNSFDLDSFLEYIATSMEVHVAKMGIEGRQLLFQTNSLNRATADLILLDRTVWMWLPSRFPLVMKTRHHAPSSDYPWTASIHW